MKTVGKYLDIAQHLGSLLTDRHSLIFVIHH
jgi:hypothetical protein